MFVFKRHFLFESYRKIRSVFLSFLNGETTKLNSKVNLTGCEFRRVEEGNPASCDFGSPLPRSHRNFQAKHRLCLGLPQTGQDMTTTWPLVHPIRCFSFRPITPGGPWGYGFFKWVDEGPPHTLAHMQRNPMNFHRQQLCCAREVGGNTERRRDKMATNGSTGLSREQKIAWALCKHFSSDSKISLGDVAENDIKGLYSNVLKSCGAPLDNNEEVMKWITFAESFPLDSNSCAGVLNGLNEDLAQKSVLLGNGLKSSAADVIVFSVVHPSLICLPNEDKEKLSHVMRWIDYIQSKEEFGEVFEKILHKKAEFEPLLEGAKNAKVVDSDVKKTSQNTKNEDKLEATPNVKKSDIEKKVTREKEATQEKKKSSEKKDASQEKKKASETEVVEKDKEVSVSLLNIQVGLIRKAWKHPSADSLLVEEIDVGEAKLHQVVSGLAKYCSPDDLTNRRVVLITNVKPGKLRDVMSEGLVLCASNEDHTIVEPLLPPEGAKPGERVSFAGIDGKPEDVLNPKKKQLEKITPHLFTDEKGVATFKGIAFMTSGGPCTSSIPNASIK